MTQSREPRPRPRLVVNVEDAQRRIAEEVRAEMGRQRLTDGEMATATGLGTQQAFSRRKLGAVPFTAGQLFAMAAYMNVPITQLVGASVPSSPPDDPGTTGVTGGSVRSTSSSPRIARAATLHRKSTVTRIAPAARKELAAA